LMEMDQSQKTGRVIVELYTAMKMRHA